MLLALEGIAGAGKSTLRDRILANAACEDIPLGHIGQFSWLSLEATRSIVSLRAGRPAADGVRAVAAVRRDLELHARHNLAPALSLGPVIADRLTLSTACLIALLHDRPVAYYVQQLAEVTTARADLIVLLTTEPELCHARLSMRATTRRFGEDHPTAARYADLYEQAVHAWTEATGLPVLHHPRHQTRPRPAGRHLPGPATPHHTVCGANMRRQPMHLDPMHPAAWVLDQLRDAGWHVHDLLCFTRASTLVLASRNGTPPVVLKAGFGSNHVLAELDEATRKAAYGFYWYTEMTEAERALTSEDFRHEIAVTRAAQGTAHVVPLLEQGSTNRFDWYTMPHCYGGSFRTHLAPILDRDDMTAGLRILADVAEGLRTLHERGIVHRDVYQENILIHDGQGLITDLGAARRADTPRGPASRGPEVHWPPEYATSYDRATPAADVFSLAVLTYRYLCADIPRHGHSRLHTAPPGLRPIITAALAPAPEDRPAMRELRDALRQAATPAATPVQRSN